MDIWKWVHKTEASLRDEGQGRLAHIIDRVPTLTCNDQHEEVDALMPEGLALAKQLNMPWVTLFLRHWHMQSAILHRYDVKERLDDVIDLLDFAHQEQHVSCPQSVCTTQDVAVAYSLLDGKGYVQERLDVAKETLDRIDPTWPCFTCISCEYANALIDAEQHQEAQDFLRTQIQALKDAGHYRWMYPELVGSLVEALIGLGQLDEALSALEEAYHPTDSEHRQVTFQLDKARVLGRLARYEEGIDSLPEWTTVWRTPAHYENMADALFALMKEEGLGNHWHTASFFGKMSTRLVDRGVYRKGVHIAHQGLKLALGRNQPHIAKWYLDIAEAAAANLRDPGDFDDQHDDFDDQIRQLITTMPTLPAEPILQEVLTDDPELNLWLLSQWPEMSDDIAKEQSGAFQAINQDEEALRVLKAHLPHCADTQMMIWSIAEVYEKMDAHAELKHFLTQHIDAPETELELKAQCHYLLSTSAGRIMQWERAHHHLQCATELKPDIPNWRPLMSTILRNLNRIEDAIEMLDAHLEEGDGTPEHQWDRMLLGALGSRWDIVRESARILGWELGDGDSPVDVNFGMCRITFADEIGQPTYWAHRNSPVTAKIVSLANPENAQHYDDLVAFEAVSSTPRPEDHPEGEPHTDTFAVFKILTPGQYRTSFTLDGFHPGPEAFEQLQDVLMKTHIALQRRSGEGYTLPLNDDERLEALYAFIGIPQDVELHEVNDALTQHISQYEHPMVWPTLALRVAEETQDRAQYEAQRTTMEKHKISD